jgi:ATP-dependent exoDNAse (exonuclease V) alpha subunit
MHFSDLTMLSKSQFRRVEALEHMTSDKQLSLVVGVAGAGKTTIMQGAKEALEAQGYRVRGAAPSGVAAASLREIGMNASTLHSLEYCAALAQEMLNKNQGKALTASTLPITILSTLVNH